VSEGANKFKLEGRSTFSRRRERGGSELPRNQQKINELGGIETRTAEDAGPCRKKRGPANKKARTDHLPPIRRGKV